jgi:DnaJ-domain-containing protein 1
MASADGNASAAEFATFQRLFHVDPSEAGNARRFYDLAKGSMAGFQAYAIQAADLLGQGSATLEDLLDALLMIAAVDGFHEAELAFLGEVATILGFDEAAQARIRRRHLAPAADDPWAVLGVEPGADAAAGAMPQWITGGGLGHADFRRLPVRDGTGPTRLERLLRAGREGLVAACRDPRTVGIEWAHWADGGDDAPPFGAGLVHADDHEAVEHTELISHLHARARRLHGDTERSQTSGVRSQ